VCGGIFRSCIFSAHATMPRTANLPCVRACVWVGYQVVTAALCRASPRCVRVYTRLLSEPPHRVSMAHAAVLIAAGDRTLSKSCALSALRCCSAYTDAFTESRTFALPPEVCTAVRRGKRVRLREVEECLQPRQSHH